MIIPPSRPYLGGQPNPGLSSGARRTWTEAGLETSGTLPPTMSDESVLSAAAVRLGQVHGCAGFEPSCSIERQILGQILAASPFHPQAVSLPIIASPPFANAKDGLLGLPQPKYDRQIFCSRSIANEAPHSGHLLGIGIPSKQYSHVVHKQ